VEGRDELTCIQMERIDEALPAAFNKDVEVSTDRPEPLATSAAS
jgi:hypothetical protein